MGLFFLVYLIPLLSVTSAQCYSPDGSLFPDNGYMPCISTNGVDSMCCLTNTTVPQVADTCLPSGQCLRGGAYYRDFCTDKTWRSPNCLNVCIGTASGGNASGLSPMTQCLDGTWCCGSSNEDCCSKNEGFKLATAISPYVVQSTHKNWLGIGLGVALGVVLLGSAAVGFLSFRLYRTTKRSMDGRGVGTSGETGPRTGAIEDSQRSGRSDGTWISNRTSHTELSPQSMIYEVPEGIELAELDGDYKRAEAKDAF